MPPDAAMQQAALQQIDRKIDQEEVARAQYDREHAKSDAILKAKAAIAGYDGTPRDRSGTASGVVGNHDRGAMEMGLHKKSDKVKGTKTTKEAAKFTKQLASESKTDQTGGDAADLKAANDAPQVEAPTSDGGVDAAPGPSGGGSDAGGSAQATATGNAAGGGTSDAGNNLTNAPPSIFSDAIDTAGKDLTEAGKKEAEAKKAALPEFKAKIEAPDAAEKKVIDSSPGDKSLNQGGEGENASAPTLTKAAPKKLKKKKPGADMASAQAESPPDVLAHLFADSLAKIDTESTTSTNPGAAPTVKFAGNSDPARAGKETVEADTKIAEAHASTAAAIAARPGTDEIQPIDIDQTVEPAEIPMPEVAEVPVDAGMAEYEAKMEEHGQAVGDAADSIQGAEFDAKLEEAQSAIDSAVGDRDTDYAAKVDESTKEVDELNKKAAEDQDKAVDDARKDVQAKHEDTKKKQDQELGKAKGKSDKARKDAEKKIEGRRKADDKSIQQKYKDAEKKAKAEKQKAESKAAAEKKKAEAKKSDSGWFSSMASAISSFVDGIASAVTKVFDAMASAVAGILNAVKDAATSMIDAAISFATSTLDALGGVLKGLVDNLIGDIFPGLAQALNDAIDSAVNVAKDAVNAIGEQLKNGVAAAIDGLNGAIQAVMNAYKAAITSALAVASAVVSGDWEKALLVLLEGALSLAGIDKSQFYGLVGQGTETIKSIVDDPGSFIGNLIDAVGQGFGDFAGNFGTHLMSGAVEWLTGSLGEAGITLPDTWDAMGIFGLVMDVMGLSVDKLKDKVGEKIGEENVAMLDTAWGYVDATIQGGLTGLWEHVQGQLSGLWDGLIDAALGFLMEKVVTAAVTKIASMFSPVGAIVQAILTAWNVYGFVQEQAQRIMGLVTSVVSSMAEIVAGQLGPAANMIESALADLVPVAISLLANLLGLGGISQKVKEIVEGLQGTVDTGIDFALDKLIELGMGAFNAIAGTTKDESTVPGDAPPASAEALGTVQFPSETTFTDSHGHGHRLWAEGANGDGQLMVASTIRTVPEQIRVWEGAISSMADETNADKQAKADATAALNNIKSLQAEADRLTDAIAGGGGNPAELEAKQNALKQPMQDLFSFMDQNGVFAGVDPRSTLEDDDYGTFKDRYKKLCEKLDMANVEAKAEEIWLTAVYRIQETQSKYDSIKATTPGHFKKQLSSKTMQELIPEFESLFTAMDPVIQQWLEKTEGNDWAFWSGKPGKDVAMSTPGWNSLEGGAIGTLFDGININGQWNMQLWGALSDRYAETLAKHITDNVKLAGFVGHGSNTVESTYNQIEKKAVARIMGYSKAAKLDWTWYACVGLKGEIAKKDKNYSHDGIEGTFDSDKDRNVAVTKAEEKNQEVQGWPPGPYPNLLEHLQGNNDASDAFDARLMDKFRQSDAPGNRDLKLPDIEGHLFHQRPTLESLFVRNSNVGTSLTTDLERIEVVVPSPGFNATRDFKTEGAPYFDDLKRGVKADLSGSVRSPTIEKSVLQTATPPIPDGAKSAIETWIAGEDPFPTPVSDIPAPSTIRAGETPHSVELKWSGSAFVVGFAPESMDWTARKTLWLAEMENLFPPCRLIAQGLIDRAEPLIDLLQRMGNGGASGTDIATKQQELANILEELYKHVPAEPVLHAARVAYERALGVKLQTEENAVNTSVTFAERANAYLIARSNAVQRPMHDANQELEILYASLGSAGDSSAYTGRGIEDAAEIEAVLTDRDSGASLAERYSHAEKVYHLMAADYLGDVASDKFVEIMEEAGLKADTMHDLAATVVQEWNDKNPMNLKTEDDLSLWGDKVDPKPAILGRWSHVKIQEQGSMRKKRSRVLMPADQTAWSEMLKTEFEALGGTYSPTEQTLVSTRGAEFIPWMEGKEEWVTNTASNTAQVWNQNSVPMGAGISGSTLRMFDAAKNFGMGGAGSSVRVLAMAFLLAFHHSFQEVMVAAAANGGPSYTPGGKTIDYSKLDPPGKDWMVSNIGPIPGDVPST